VSTTARSYIRDQTIWIAGMDLLCLLAGCAVGVTMRFGHEEIRSYVYGHLEGWIIFFSGVLLANYLAGSYKPQYTFSRFNLTVTWIFSMLFAMMILSITSFAWLKILLGRGVLFLSIASYGVIALLVKMLLYRSLFRSEFFLYRTVIIGTDETARGIRRMLEGSLVMPAHKIVAFINISEGQRADAARREDMFCDGVVVLNVPISGVEDCIHSLGVSLIVTGIGDVTEAARFYPQLRRLRFEGTEVLSALGVSEVFSGRVPLNLIGEEFLMQASMESVLPMIRQIKRLSDIIASLLACVVLLPVALIVALIIKITDPGGPVFYVQSRMGRFGTVFRILKFRTMRQDAENGTGAVWAALDDPRVTKVGRFLRRFRLDEIPQLINVLKGEMSIVGPRPERPELVHELEKSIPFYVERQNVMPGLTGWAQIRYPYGSTVEDAARKLEYDLYYMKNLSLALDLQIILSTLRIVMFGKERNV
jgi:exopolysaccharide biosynthesis polyprenyl glycosylphosphotransferase